ncbi:MAG: tRNA-2-methylthio-N(6)-dimethylallyladenosine synthase [Sodalis sp.]|nr:MAG: tRNA-2-methylthio-N(6)-dimethylallyladenosine synthase [Sodalis sp.]
MKNLAGCQDRAWNGRPPLSRHGKLQQILQFLGHTLHTRVEKVSRPCDDILFEIAQLVDQDVRTVNLLGQNVNAYPAPHARV